MQAKDAAAALRTVDTMRERSAAFRRYAHAASAVILWGAIWLVCNVLSQFFAWGPKSWLVGLPIGILWSLTHPLPRRAGARPYDFRAPLSIFAGFAFLWLAMLISPPVVHPGTFTTLESLLVAAGYVIAGIWIGARLTLLGIALTAAICLGWFVFPQWLHLWLGIGGGGALILGGIWLARA